MPFTVEQFFDVFRSYNLAVFPAQVVLTLLALIAVLLALWNGPKRSGTITLLLAVLWVWCGAVYHILFFSRVNTAAISFGAGFLAQGVMLVYSPFSAKPPRFSPGADSQTALGLVLIVYSLVVYPVLGSFFGHVYPASPTFGAPCPLTIFTFGIFLWIKPAPPVPLVIVPFIWAAVGSTAAWNFGMLEDLALVAAALVCIAVALVGTKSTYR